MDGKKSQSPEGSIYMEFKIRIGNIVLKIGLSRPKAQSTWNDSNTFTKMEA